MLCCLLIAIRHLTHFYDPPNALYVFFLTRRNRELVFALRSLWLWLWLLWLEKKNEKIVPVSSRFFRIPTVSFSWILQFTFRFEAARFRSLVFQFELPVFTEIWPVESKCSSTFEFEMLCKSSAFFLHDNLFDRILSQLINSDNYQWINNSDEYDNVK